MWQYDLTYPILSLCCSDVSCYYGLKSHSNSRYKYDARNNTDFVIWMYSAQLLSTIVYNVSVAEEEDQIPLRGKKQKLFIDLVFPISMIKA